MYTLLAAFVIAYGAVMLAIVLLQRHMMYHPNRHIGTPQQYGLLGVSNVVLTAADATTLHAWVHTAREGAPTIVYFHGNAGNLGDRCAKFSAFTDNGFGLVAISYRGFGESAGAPHEQGIYADARAAIDYCLSELHLRPNQLIYFGESLGSGVAVQMASERPPALMMLEAAYTSVETRSAEMFPYLLCVRRLVHDKYDSLRKISGVHAPLVMIHGTLDSTIPLHHGKALFAAANEPKSLVIYPEVHHTDYTNEQILAPLLQAAGTWMPSSKVRS